jgi:hypothetical protein
MATNPSNDTLRRLASWTYWAGVGHLYTARQKNYPLFPPIQAYYNWARDFNIDGFLAHSLLSCRTATFWLPYTANILKNELEIPSMSIEGDIVDLTVFDPDEIMENAQAFEDSMDHYKEQRRVV